MNPRELDYLSGIQSNSFRNSWVAVRSALRVLLSDGMGVDIKTLTISYGESGKPFVEGCPFHFNVSHSGSKGLIALSEDKPIGVDLEAIRWRKGLHRLANRFLHPAEAEQLENLAESDMAREFTRLWTAREALVKATGQGIGSGFSKFHVQYQEKDQRYRVDDPENVLLFPCEVWSVPLQGSDFFAALALGV